MSRGKERKSFQSRLDDLHYDLTHQYRTNLKRITIAFIGVLFVSFVIPVFLVQRTSSVADTRINTWYNLGTSNIQVRLKNREYNAKEHFMIMQFEVKNEMPDVTNLVTDKDIDFGFATEPKQRLAMSIVPTSNHTFTAVVRGINSRYHAIFVNLRDGSLGQDNALQSGTASSSEDSTMQFVVNRNDKIINNNLKFKSQQTYAVEAIDNLITEKKNSIKNANGRIQKLQDLIKNDQTDLATLEKNADDFVGGKQVDNKQTKDQLLSEIVDAKTQINDENKKIDSFNKQIDDYKNQQNGIKNGSIKLQKVWSN
ncbi:hypothetical protein EQG49_00335 [Periweissella cryptocerci]|uniref:Uncharacterized protein n=1 Tax=Periweissella cryptocerci TaxID=2506420 RepID=A0A4P6YQZ1_9LACO|nr:hypothetical protein [Periweissella cryptocerci]QBO35002.1 hypothetical protein EQG49_00335 [Periweissella cryptocerci]